MAGRHEVTDPQWEMLKPIVEKEAAETGRPRREARQMVSAILWILRTGAPWRDLPERFGPWQSAYDYFMRWRADGTFDRILETLQVRLDAEGKIDWDLWCIDGTNVRASRAAAGASKKVPSGTRRNRKITRWGARAADSAANSTWSLTVRDYR